MNAHRLILALTLALPLYACGLFDNGGDQPPPDPVPVPFEFQWKLVQAGTTDPVNAPAIPCPAVRVTNIVALVGRGAMAQETFSFACELNKGQSRPFDLGEYNITLEARRSDGTVASRVAPFLMSNIDGSAGVKPLPVMYFQVSASR